ncbi:NAD(P)-binding protein [Gautieria morchelliformis]|nr:NAD(P)-binding protein [Gautieria morchelliformis]
MGIIPSLIREARPAKALYDPARDVPDLSDKVIIVTGTKVISFGSQLVCDPQCHAGGNTGIGYEIVKQLLLKNGKVYVATRDRKKSEVAIDKLQNETGKLAYFLPLDLADLESVKASADEFKSKETELHVLFNNAGLSEPPIGQLTKQGIDMQFGVNVLGHYHFTSLLLPALIAGAQSSGDGKARVVNLASSSHLLTNCLWWDTFEDGPARRSKNLMYLYNQSKFGNVVFSHELARRYGEKGIVSTAVNPGIIRSELQRYYGAVKNWVLDNILLWDTPYGAMTPLYAGTAPEGKDFNGMYLVPWARIGSARKETHNRDTGERLWTWLEEKTKGF